MKWFNLDWWKYILEAHTKQITFFRTILCRINNHPDGVIYYNATGLEPDMHCKNCGDDLG
jgi:hypothetical protein